MSFLFEVVELDEQGNPVHRVEPPPPRKPRSAPLRADEAAIHLHPKAPPAVKRRMTFERAFWLQRRFTL